MDGRAPSSIWSIAIFTGDSPLRLTPHGNLSAPVLTAAEVSDVPGSFVADPFAVRESGEWLMFFEIMSSETGRGEIGLAKSRDGLCWQYHSSVLREPFHLSYPNVFEFQGDYYMVPETLSQGAIVLYRASRFPFEWQPVARLVEGQFADATPFRFEGMWWMFACSTPYKHDTLRLYYSRDLAGGWTEHASSPVIEKNPAAARPAGRMISFNGKLIRYTQDCSRYYGYRLRAFEITRLNPVDYEEHECAESPILSPGDGANGKAWNSAGMHHADAHLLDSGTWLACVDGHRFDDGDAARNRQAGASILSRLLGRTGRRA
jgi:hypothetical protein